VLGIGGVGVVAAVAAIVTVLVVTVAAAVVYEVQREVERDLYRSTNHSNRQLVQYLDKISVDHTSETFAQTEARRKTVEIDVYYSNCISLASTSYSSRACAESNTLFARLFQM